MDQAVTPNKSTKSLIPTLKDKNGQLDSIQPTAVDLNIWEAIEQGPYVPSIIARSATIEKPRADWTK